MEILRRLCARPEDPVLRLRDESLRMNGWKPCKTISMVNWCDHGQEFSPVPDDDGWIRMIPVLREAAE